MDFSDSSTFSTASGKDYHYVVLQVTLKEKFLGTGSGNLTELEEAINHQAQKGYRLHTITTSNGGSKGLMGGDRIQATMVFKRLFNKAKTALSSGFLLFIGKSKPELRSDFGILRSAGEAMQIEHGFRDGQSQSVAF